MYWMQIDGITFYDDTMTDDISYRLIDYKLVIEDNKAGSLNLVVPPTNRKYAQFTPTGVIHRPVIRVYADEDIIWIGRAVSVKLDFWNRANVFCEGALSWLADVRYEGLERTQVYNLRDVAGTKIAGVLSGYQNHLLNSPYEIEQGNVTMEIEGEAEWGSTYGYAPAQSPDTSKTCLQRATDLVSIYGGHIQTAYQLNSPPELVWWADLWASKQSGSYTQTANFGENLLDYVRSFSNDEVFTVLRPYGDIKDNAPKTIDPIKTPLITSDKIHNYRRINLSGVEEQSPSSLQNVTDVMNIVKGRKYYYSGHMRSNFCLFVIRDSVGNVYNLKSNHGGETIGSMVIQEFTDVEIPIPEFAQEGGYTIQCGFWQDTAYETEKSVTLLDYSNLYYVDEDTSENEDKYRVKLTDSGYPTETYEISSLVSRYGWIEKRIDFQGINSADGLYFATVELANEIAAKDFNLESLTINFLDMAYFIQSDAPKVGTAVVGSAILSDGSTRVPPLKLYDGVRVVSDPHHVDTIMYVTKIELSINPANSKYTLGVSKEKGISALVGG